MKRKVKLCTFIDRGGYFFDKWLTYHLQYFKSSEMIFIFQRITDFNLQDYLISKGITDSRIINAEVAGNRIYELNKLCNETQAQALKENDVFIFLDQDELLFHPGLRELLDTFTESHLVTRGLELFHSRASGEGVLIKSEPILSQRKYCFWSDWYNKPIIIREPLDWELGKHLHGKRKYSMEDLLIIHINKVDFNMLLDLNIETETIFHTITNQRVKELKTNFNEWFLNMEKFKEDIPGLIKNLNI